ncbi:MAG: hypothetical protein M1817_004336 [Caeruleum heppii]|nr:MAG: hypothetical protein M1817_004336 [Caeruleum heppii]
MRSSVLIAALFHIAGLQRSDASPISEKAVRATYQEAHGQVDALSSEIKRQVDPDSYDCTRGHSAEFDPVCWYGLELDTFITNWWADDAKGGRCATQVPPPGFANCFVNYYGAGTDCDSISEKGCITAIPTSETQNLTPMEKAQVRLVIHNLAAINNFFSTWYEAVKSAQANDQSFVGKVIQLADPTMELSHDYLKQFILDALLAAFAFVPGVGPAVTVAGAGGVKAIEGAAAAAVKTFKTVEGVVQKVSQARAQVANTVQAGKQILGASAIVASSVFRPDGSAISQVKNEAELSEKLLNLNIEASLVIEPGLKAAVNDPEQFRAFAGSGAYCGTSLPSVVKSDLKFTQAESTYLLSQSLKDAGWVIVVSKNTDLGALKTNYTDIKTPEWNGDSLGCPDGFDSRTICNIWWYDQEENQTFSLVKTNSIFDNPLAIIQSLGTNDDRTALTTPELFFKAAQKCRTAMGDGWQAGFQPGFTEPSGSLSLDCLNVMKVCTFNMEATDLNDGTQRYYESDCAAEEYYGPHWWAQGTGTAYGTNWNFQFQIPPGEMGPLVQKGSPSERYPLVSSGTVYQNKPSE